MTMFRNHLHKKWLSILVLTEVVYFESFSICECSTILKPIKGDLSRWEIQTKTSQKEKSVLTHVCDSFWLYSLTVLL